jgi:ElaB/YqjD/DUF883 family membrane-anchored ribosome-binding protein
MTQTETRGGFVSQQGDDHSHDDAAEIEDLRRRIQTLQEDFAQADRRLRAAVRERPFVALGAAIAAGFILGRVISRA